jgi:hypothetical protein
MNPRPFVKADAPVYPKDLYITNETLFGQPFHLPGEKKNQSALGLTSSQEITDKLYSRNISDKAGANLLGSAVFLGRNHDLRAYASQK